MHSNLDLSLLLVIEVVSIVQFQNYPLEEKETHVQQKMLKWYSFFLETRIILKEFLDYLWQKLRYIMNNCISILLRILKMMHSVLPKCTSPSFKRELS